MTSLSEEDQEPLKPATGVLTPEDLPASILEQESLEKGIPKGSPVLEQVESVQPPHNVVESEEPLSSEELPVPLANCLARMSEEVALLRQDMAKRIEDLEQELERREKYIEDNMELATQVCKTRFDQLQQEMQTQKDFMKTNRQLAEKAHEQVRQRATRRDLAQTKQQLQVLVAAISVIVAVSFYFISPSCDCHLRMAEIETYTAVIPINITVPTHSDTSGSCVGEPFYTHFHGYKVCLVISTGGNETTCNKGSNIAVGVRLMPGEFDENMNWPFHGNFIIQLLNGRERQIILHYPITAGDRVIGNGGTVGNWSCTDVAFNHSNDETLQFRVSRFEQGQGGVCGDLPKAFEQHKIVPDYQQNLSAVAWQNISDEIKQHREEMRLLTAVVPVNVTMPYVQIHSVPSDSCIGEPFYTHFHGYKVCLVALTDNTSKNCGGNLTVGVRLLPGEFDDNLNWPFYGRFTIQLLISNETFGNPIIFNYSSTAGDKVIDNRGTDHSWKCTDISYSKRQHMKSETLLFRVSRFEQPPSSSKITLEDVSKMVKCQNTESFAYQQNHSAIANDLKRQQLKMLTAVIPVTVTIRGILSDQTSHYSEPFYTFFRGYKVCIVLGGINNNTEVISLQLHLMRGEFDDTLEWPFRGNFTIELENKKGHSRAFVLHYPATEGNRVTVHDMGNHGCPLPRFISRKDLELYSHGDILSFRVTHFEPNQSSIIWREIEKVKELLLNETHYQRIPVNVRGDQNHTILPSLQMKQADMWSIITSVLPLNISLKEFRKHQNSKEKWESDPFYTRFRGYKLLLRVCASGCGKAAGTHVSVSLVLMRGEFDKELAWPFKGTVHIGVLSVTGESKILYAANFSDATGNVNGQVTSGETASKGWGSFTYVSFKELPQFLEEDTITFQLTGDVFSKLSPSSEKKQSPDNLNVSGVKDNASMTLLHEINMMQMKQANMWSMFMRVLPLNILLKEFGEQRRSKTQWESEPFYTHFRGYKMVLHVYASGRGKAAGTHVSVSLVLMHGEFDQELSWPFRGIVHIGLLSVSGKVQNVHTANFSDATINVNGRVTAGEKATIGWNSFRFVAHMDLQQFFLTNDSIWFRLAIEELPDNVMPLDLAQKFTNVTSSMKTMWSVLTNTLPLNIRMREFTPYRNSDQHWYSEPFYTHFHGYKMCLRVDPNGNGDGTGTHVSIFLYLMRGEFDDKLNWPFRAKLQIWLENHLTGTLEEPGHITFHQDRGARVLSTERSATGRGIPEYVAHDKLDLFLDKEKDVITFQVALLELPNDTYMTMSGPLSLSQHSSMWSMLMNILPLNITMTHWTVYDFDFREWYSDPFYTQFHGYKMRLRVYPINFQDTSVFICMMRGEFDDKLAWPFQGTLKVELLDRYGQWGNSHTLYHTSGLFSSVDNLHRVTTEEIATCTAGSGWLKFVTYTQVISTYLREDSLTFRVALV